MYEGKFEGITGVYHSQGSWERKSWAMYDAETDTLYRPSTLLCPPQIIKNFFAGVRNPGNPASIGWRLHCGYCEVPMRGVCGSCEQPMPWTHDYLCKDCRGM